MKITTGNKITKSNPKNIYRLEVETIIINSDKINKFHIDIPDTNTELLNKLICYCEVIKKQYPQGRHEGSGFYNHLDFFDKYFEKYWNYEGMSHMDDFKDYKVTYFNEYGEESKTIINLDDEDEKLINFYKVEIMKFEGKEWIYIT